MNLPGLDTAVGSELEFRPIEKADLAQWYELILRIFAAEKAPWHDQLEDLENSLNSSKNDPLLDTVIGVDQTGIARAFAQVRKNPEGAKAYVSGGVDPEWQRRGIGSALLNWQLERVAHRFSDRQQSPAIARTYAEENNPVAQELFTANGFNIVRYFSEMHRPLSEEIPVIDLDENLVLTTFSSEHSEAVRLAHNEVFADHWGSEPRDLETWRDTVEHPFFRADWSLVVLDASTAEVAGYQLASYDQDIFSNFGRKEGYTELIGVRRAYRGRRIAAALLAEAMRRFRAAGMDVASLDVDTESPTGANTLYERMGYRSVRRSMAFDRIL